MGPVAPFVPALIGGAVGIYSANKQAQAAKDAAKMQAQSFLRPEQQAMYGPLQQAILANLQSQQSTPQAIKDAMFANMTSRLQDEVRAQTAASDRDMIRRGFGINSGESLNQMRAINANYNRAMTDAARQVETYADQAARQARDNAIAQAMGFAGLNSALAGQSYVGAQNALQQQGQAYQGLGQFGTGLFQQGIGNMLFRNQQPFGGSGGIAMALR